MSLCQEWNYHNSKLSSPAKNETIKAKETLFITGGDENISKLKSICFSEFIGLKMRKIIGLHRFLTKDRAEQKKTQTITE